MPPKGRRSAGSEKSKQSEEEREDPLQAVILADSFETKFTPFTLERPRCLLPLANTPLIEYTFEFLANAGVEEVFVYCGAHTEQVESYIHSSKWSSSSSPFTQLTPIRSTSTSIGDAMRDLDKRALLTNDFIVVYGDVITNINLQPALAAHRARRAKDKNAIMTMLLRNAGPAPHRTKPPSTTPVFVIDPDQDRCLHYQQMHHTPNSNTASVSTSAISQPTTPTTTSSHSSSSSPQRITIDPDLLTIHPTLDIHATLLDPGIDICTPDVLALWSDYFDAESPRSGWLYSVLKDYELNGKTIHTHIIEDSYAARVRDWSAYRSVTQDVVGRWAYPLCPDSNFVKGQGYRFLRGLGVYRDEGVVLARDCAVGGGSVVGRDAVVGEGSKVWGSVVGRGVRIGRGCRVEASYLWDGVVVGDGCTVRQAAVAGKVVLGRRCRVEPGALISFGVKIADGTVVKGGSRITRAKTEELEKETDPRVVGEGGIGHEYHDPDIDEDDAFDSATTSSLIYSSATFTQSTESISTLASSPSSSDLQPHLGDRSDRSSFVSVESEDSQGGEHFHHDAATSIYDSLTKGDQPDNIQVELTALRLSTNASDHQVRRAIAVAFMKRIASFAESPDQGIKSAVTSVIGEFGKLIERNLGSHSEDKVDFLLCVQNDLCRRKDGDKILVFLVTEMYKRDLVEKEVFESWWEDKRSNDGQEMQDVKSRTGQFMDVLKEEDEEDESSEESSEEDDEDE
ncbi:MAG: hypothetical protein M1820_008077 [Bogoriella megaspora]|nr:MAG: hypothetical protein M1820_008077 [Bogoriella megaspora]